jgi:hypothetical protein
MTEGTKIGWTSREARTAQSLRATDCTAGERAGLGNDRQGRTGQWRAAGRRLAKRRRPAWRLRQLLALMVLATIALFFAGFAVFMTGPTPPGGFLRPG